MGLGAIIRGAHKLAFGADLAPGCCEDLDLADLVVYSGHIAAWTHPVLFPRMEQARARGQRSAVTTRLGRGIAARASFDLNHEGEPPAGRLQTDTTSRLTLVYSF